MSKYALPAKPAEAFQLSEESAMEQVLDFLNYYDIDIARVDDPTSLTVVERTLDNLRDYIREGKVEIRRDKDAKLEVVHNLTGGTAVAYRELNAAAKLAMDRLPPNAGTARAYALMGSLCGLGTDGIQKFGPRDLTVVELLSQLFMSA
jgi:hypothetical protein